MRRGRFGVRATAVLLSGLLLVGCGGDSLGTISGKVTHQGNPVKKGKVTFYAPATGGAAEATLDEDGSYHVVTAEGGLPPGEYKVCVQPLLVVDEASGRGGQEIPRMVPDGGEDIPEKYRSDVTSDLKLTVVPGENTYDITLVP